MNTLEIGKLLAYIQAGDNRTIGAVDLALWGDTLPTDFSFNETRKAVTLHRQETAAWITPAHVIANVRRLRQEAAHERAKREALEAPERIAGQSTAGPPWWFAQMVRASSDEHRRQKAAGHPPQPDKFRKYPNDYRSITELLVHYGITAQPGDEMPQTFVPSDYLKD